MRAEEHKICRSYVLYREDRARKRKEEESSATQSSEKAIQYIAWGGENARLELSDLRSILNEACLDLKDVDAEFLLKDLENSLFEGISEENLLKALVLSARSLVEQDPNYSFVAARLLLRSFVDPALRKLGYSEGSRAFASFELPGFADRLHKEYSNIFSSTIEFGINSSLLNPDLAEVFDLDLLGSHIDSKRDFLFSYLGLQTLFDRYFLRNEDVVFELPQVFLMRVCMGLALREENPNARALEFYDVISSFRYMASTPTLFNSGTLRSQLSSCYISTIDDSLDEIYMAIRDNALLSKWAGGLGNDWTPVRSLGARIKGTNGTSQGVVPFLKVVNDTAVAVNQGGKRKGAVCSYLETWHLDIEEFLKLKKNTGDDRRRTHDMNTANWVPDLFMERVFNGQEWTLFSPDDVPELHGLVGKKFAKKYRHYEKLAEEGILKNYKKINSVGLWRKMLSMLFETGHPWITFKDPCNLRSTQQHVGNIHSSNLCTEITLNTSKKEIAVCNLGSVNIVAHLSEGKIDKKLLKDTVNSAVRMLDNVIDINYYAVKKAKRANMRHRAIGLGVMGLQDSLYNLNIPFASEAAVEFSDEMMEAISYYAILASSGLAKERGSYKTFKSSLWDKGILPIDSLDLLEEERGQEFLKVDRTTRLDWSRVRKAVSEQGMRNSNVLAIAPTATIANIVGVSPCIEPTYQNLYVKANLSGQFTVINEHLVKDLKKIGLWDSAMIKDLKFYDGSLEKIDRVPDSLKRIYQTAFEIHPKWVIEAASRRQKWIDQSQSVNIWIKNPSGALLDSVYKNAWLAGLKTTYYLRSLGATDPEKSTLERSNLNAVASGLPSEEKDNPAFSPKQAKEGQNPGPQEDVPSVDAITSGKACLIDDPDCEACQ